MTTLAGILRDSGGNPITGTLWLEISQAGTFSPGAILVTPLQPSVFNLTAGSISGPGGGPYSVYGNDGITPSITFYRLTAFDAAGSQVLRLNVNLTGASVDMGAMTIAPTQSWVVPPGYILALGGDVTGPSTAGNVGKIHGKAVVAPPWTPGHVMTVQADQSLAPAAPVIGTLAVASDVGTADTGIVQPLMAVSVGGGASELKLATANGDLVLMDGAVRIVSFGSGNGGSAGQARWFGPIYHRYPLTDAAGLVEAIRIAAACNRSTGGPTAALNITTNAADGTDITGVFPFHCIQFNIAAKATDVRAELGGVVAFLEQHGIRTTSIVPFDSSAQISNDASGPVANMVGVNVGLKNDYLGNYGVGNDTLASGLFVRQASVGSSLQHGGNFGSFVVLRVDRPQWWDYTTGTITAALGTGITGSGTTWTSVPKTGEAGVCSLKGKWITWTATSGTVVSKRISSVTTNTALVLTEAIVAGETAAAGTAYRIVMSDPWDSVITASGIGASPAIDLTPEDRLAPSRFAGVYAVQTADPTTPATKWGWTWNGIARFLGLKTVQASAQPPFITARAKASYIAITGTGLVDIPNATVTVTPPINCRAVVMFTVDASMASADTLIVKLLVNGSVQDVELILNLSGVGSRCTSTQQTTVELTGGTAYTIKMQAAIAGAGNYNIFGPNSGLTVTAVGSA